MIRKMAVVRVIALWGMLVVTGPTMSAATPAVNLPEQYTAEMSRPYATGPLNERQMARIMGGQGCFGLGPSCCEIIGQVVVASTWLGAFNIGFYPLLRISSASYKALCV